MFEYLFPSRTLSSVSQSINVIECREFRELILILREELRDEDIPHRTKLRKSIIDAWLKRFELLVKELQVVNIFFPHENMTN